MSSKLPELYNTYLNQFPRYSHNNRKKKSDSKASKENDKLVKILNTKMFKGYTKIKESHTKHSEYKFGFNYHAINSPLLKLGRICSFTF